MRWSCHQFSLFPIGLYARLLLDGVSDTDFVVPLLVESGFRELVDRVLVVDCPVEKQRARLMARDGETEESANDMIHAQISREDRLAAADDVISNDAGPEALEPAVQTLHEKYEALAAGQIPRTAGPGKPS